MPQTYDLRASHVGKEHQCKTSGQHVSPSGPPQEKHQNIHNRRTWVCAESTHFPPGVRQKNLCKLLLYSKQSCVFPLHPVLSCWNSPWDTAGWLAKNYGTDRYRRVPLPSSPGQGSAPFTPPSCSKGGDQSQEWREAQLSSSKPQVLLALISPRAWLCWYLPMIHFKVLTAILVALRKAPGEVTTCWREASDAPTAIFSLGSEEDHTVRMFFCLPACPSVCQHPLLPHVLSNFWIHCPISTKTYWQLKAHKLSCISWKPAVG